MNPEEIFYTTKDGIVFKYDPNEFENFYKQYEKIASVEEQKAKVDVLEKWVLYYGKPVKSKSQIKKGDFVVAFGPTGAFSFSGFAHHTVFNLNTECWQTEDGYSFNPDYKRLFICKSGLLVIPKLEGEALSAKHFVPRTIEEAERFCTEVTG